MQLNNSKNAILQTLRSVKLLLEPYQYNKGKLLLILTCIVSVLDVLALATVVPVLMLAIDGDFLAKSSKLRAIYNYTGFATEGQFLISLIIGVVIFFIVKNILALYIQKKINQLCNQLVQHFTEQNFYSIVQQPFSQIVQEGTANMFHKIHFNSYQYAAGVLLPFVGFVAEIVVVIFIIILILLFNPTIFILIGCITGPAFYLINKAIKNKIYQLGNETKNLREKTIDNMNISINGFADIKINHSAGYFINEFLSNQRKIVYNDLKAINLQLIPSRANEIVVLIGVIILVCYGFFFSQNPGGLRVIGTIFVLAVFRLVPAINRLLIALMKIKMYQYTVEDILNNQNSKNTLFPLQKMEFNHQLKLQNIHFKHSNANQKLLNNLNITINKGEIVGISGISGSGKSTLLRIIAALIKPNEGNIFIDQQPLDEKHQHAWQNTIGFVHQSPFIFNQTVAENIALSKEINQEKLNNAIVQSGIAEFIENLPQKINTRLGEQGAKISEGQKQRIAIARAIYKNAQLVLLDEATSALNKEAEEIIMETIKNLKQQKVTILIIAHQNNLLSLCDTKYILKDGELIYDRNK